MLTAAAAALGAACALLAVQPANAQSNPNDRIEDLQLLGPERFNGTMWSQSYPGLDYDRGCQDGFLAFAFNETGYFIYNQRMDGSWEVDPQGNLVLRTRDGERLRMIVNGDSMSPQRDASFAKRTDIYTRCPQL